MDVWSTTRCQGSRWADVNDAPMLLLGDPVRTCPLPSSAISEAPKSSSAETYSFEDFHAWCKARRSGKQQAKGHAPPTTVPFLRETEAQNRFALHEKQEQLEAILEEIEKTSWKIAFCKATLESQSHGQAMQLLARGAQHKKRLKDKRHLCEMLDLELRATREALEMKAFEKEQLGSVNALAAETNDEEKMLLAEQLRINKNKAKANAVLRKKAENLRQEMKKRSSKEAHTRAQRGDQ